MQTPTIAAKGDKIQHELMPGFPAAIAETYEPAAGDQVSPPERLEALATQWEQASDDMRAQAVSDGLHPALARGHAEANALRERAAELRAVLAGDPR